MEDRKETRGVNIMANESAVGLQAGEVYNLIYAATVNGHRGVCCEGGLKCLEVGEENYLLERKDGTRFQIRFCDVECMLEGDPGGLMAAYAERL